MPNAISGSPVPNVIIGVNERPNREQDNTAVARSQAAQPVERPNETTESRSTQRVSESPPPSNDTPRGRIDTFA